MKGKVKIGILGCANIAERYSIKAFQNIPNAEVWSIASRDKSKASEWASRFGIPNSEDYDSLIKNKEIEAVYIPLPIGLHEGWIIKAARQGKHVMSEKSLSTSLKSVNKIVDSCREHGVVLYENFTCDYHPQHQKVLEIIGSGEIGTPLLFQSIYGFPIISLENFRYNKELGGSALNESGSYQVYTARKLFGREPVSIQASLYFNDKTGVDMNGSVIMDFGENLWADFSFNLDAVYQNYYSVWGKKGLIKVNRAYAIPPTLKPSIDLLKNEDKQETITPIDIRAHNHFESIFQEFCDLVLSGDKNKIEKKYSDVLSQAKALEAIRLSSKEGRAISISEL